MSSRAHASDDKYGVWDADLRRLLPRDASTRVTAGDLVFATGVLIFADGDLAGTGTVAACVLLTAAEAAREPPLDFETPRSAGLIFAEDGGRFLTEGAIPD